MNRSPTYEEDSRKIAEQVKQAREEQMAAARKLLGDEALRSVQKLVELRDQEVEIGASLKAAQHILKLCGLEVEKTILSNDPENPILPLVLPLEKLPGAKADV